MTGTLKHTIKMMATAIAVAFIVYSCKSQLGEADKLNLEDYPVQRVENMFAVQSANGIVSLRLEADVMERYERDSISLETFPKGFAVYGYTSEGLLETMILADNALHETNRNSGEEKWSAFGNVVVQNTINRQTMETDTIYWDRKNQEIYTDCYVRMYSPDGFLQGYGMRSDEKAENSIILKPVNSFVVVVKDSTAVVIDSVNFIGPFKKN